jgi:uncharacterized membrane protein YdbT with pleckstrin-like domain
MSYVKDNLMPNEKVLFTARVHLAIFLPSIFTFLITFAFFIYGLNNSAIVSKVGSPPPQVNSINLIGTMLLCVSFFLFLYSVLLGLQALIVLFTTEFAVTNRRVIAKIGFIRRHTLEMLLSKIESVSVRQNILGRLINFGTVTVTGTGGTRESFRAIVDPIGVRKNINQIIEGYMQYQQNLSNQQKGG